MKNFLIALLCVLFVTGTVTTQAQCMKHRTVQTTSVSSTDSTTHTPGVVFLGGTYNNPERKFTTSVGTGLSLGKGVWALVHGKFGDGLAFEPEVAYFQKVYKGVVIGLLAGPGADWVKTDDLDGEASPINYITGAGGGLIGYEWNKISVYTGGKYKFTYDKDTFYPTGWRVGMWFVYKII